MDRIYSYGGKPYQRNETDLWDRSGHYVGRFKADLVFDTRGRYRGEMRNGKLAYNPMHANRIAGACMARMNRLGIAVGNRIGSILPAGWRHFEQDPAR